MGLERIDDLADLGGFQRGARHDVIPVDEKVLPHPESPLQAEHMKRTARMEEA